MTLILIKLKITINFSQFLRTIWTCANQNCSKKIHVNNNLVIAISNQFLKLKRNIHASSDIIVRKTKSWNKIKSHFINGIIAESRLSPSLPSSGEAKPSRLSIQFTVAPMNYPRPSPFWQLYSFSRRARRNSQERKEGRAKRVVASNRRWTVFSERGKGGDGPTMRCDQRNLILEEEGTVTRPETRCLL